MLILSFFASYTIYGVLSPYLSVLVRSLGYSRTLVGVLLGFFEIAGIAGPLIFGRLADHQARYRPSLFLSYILIAAALAPLVYLRHPAISAAALVFLAFGLKSIIPLLDAMTTLRLGPSGDYGKIRVVGSISFVLMSLFVQYSPILRPVAAEPIAAWAALTVAFSLLALGLLGETPKPDKQKTKVPAGKMTVGQAFMATESAKSLTDRPSPRWDSAFLIGLIMIALNRLSFSPVVSFFSLYLTEELKWDAVGLLWALSAFAEIPIIFISTRLLKRYAPVKLLIVSALAVIVRLALYAVFPNKAGAVAGQILHALCYGLFHPAAVAFVSLHVPPAKRGLGMAMYLSLGVGLPTFLGSAVGGLIADAAGYRLLFVTFIPFALISLLVALPLLRRRVPGN